MRTSLGFYLSPHMASDDWYWDGVEGGVQCWRLDLDNEIQIQLFAEEVIEDDHFWEATRLFIERDVRELRGPSGREDPVRVFYACDAWPVTNEVAKSLLLLDMDQVAALLADKLAHVRGLPDDSARYV